MLAEALRRADDTEIGFYEPEMHRVQGELLLARAGADSVGRRSLLPAGHRRRPPPGREIFELRAVLSLSRLYRQQGKEEEARPMLAETYGWFTEGFDTADLREAGAFLEIPS